MVTAVKHVQAAVKRITHAAIAHPLATNVATGAVLGAVGDAVCQLWVEGADRLDTARLGALVVFGGVYNGAIVTGVYRTYPWVVARLPMAARATPTHRAAAAAALDQGVHCPLLYTPAFYLAVGMMQGATFDEATVELKDKYTETVVACAGFWTPFMFFNFLVVPKGRQVLVMQCGNLVWNVIIDYIAHRGQSA